jgi:hypothetical protein
MQLETITAITDEELLKAHEAAIHLFWQFSNNLRLRQLAEAIKKECDNRNLQVREF